jgi:hypothetical protein
LAPFLFAVFYLAFLCNLYLLSLSEYANTLLSQKGIEARGEGLRKFHVTAITKVLADFSELRYPQKSKGDAS